MARGIVESLCPHVLKFVEVLMKEEGIGIAVDHARISEPKSSLADAHHRGPRQCDRFKVSIPFAGSVIKWEVIFDALHQEYPPDFIFGDQDQDFAPDIEKLKALSEWDEQNPESLLLVIKELIAEYKIYQQQLIQEHERMQFEFSTLADHELFSNFEVQVVKVKQDFGQDEVAINFLIKLPIDISQIPPYLIKDNPGPDLACLLVSYQPPQLTQVTPRLLLSPRVEHALGGAGSLRIPYWNSTGGSCLFDYVPNIYKLLVNKIEQICTGFQKRREYISAFLSAYGSSILEYDVETFERMSLLFEVQGFFCIIHIEIPVSFPQEQPLFIVQSIYHELDGAPYEMEDRTYPYSPRWTMQEMVERTRTYLSTAIPTFKKYSLTMGKF